MSVWKPFPHDSAQFNYGGQALAEQWPVLHRGDCIPFPGDDWVCDLLEQVPLAAPPGFDGDTAGLASGIRAAWRCYHAGDFRQSVELADQCGLMAHACANKATGIHASYLQEGDQQQASFQTAIERAEHAVRIFGEDANSHYFRAFNLGRYGQSISIIEALKRGMAGKIHESLTVALELAPEHAEAHTAMGMYHAEIINKVGKLMGGITYGANANEALEHFETALELTPNAPVAHVEFANGLYLLFGDRRLDEVTDLYIRASEMHARDAMEKLDIEAAMSELE
jgi:tetratricopeptide (TPR) repeat protein